MDTKKLKSRNKYLYIYWSEIPDKQVKKMHRKDMNRYRRRKQKQEDRIIQKDL